MPLAVLRRALLDAPCAVATGSRTWYMAPMTASNASAITLVSAWGMLLERSVLLERRYMSCTTTSASAKWGNNF